MSHQFSTESGTYRLKSNLAAVVHADCQVVGSAGDVVGGYRDAGSVNAGDRDF